MEITWRYGQFSGEHQHTLSSQVIFFFLRHSCSLAGLGCRGLSVFSLKSCSAFVCMLVNIVLLNDEMLYSRF